MGVGAEAGPGSWVVRDFREIFLGSLATFVPLTYCEAADKELSNAMLNN